MHDQTLYEILGKENLQLMVDRFYELVEQDERINHLFKSDFETIKRKQLLFLTQFMGGPQLYSAEFGHPRMRMRHLPHTITEAAAVAWLENMRTSISELPVNEKLKQTLFSVFPRLASHMVNTYPDSKSDQQ